MLGSQLLQTLNQLSRIIGNTPVLRAERLPFRARVWLKLEYTNPGGSHKDRTALYMLRGAVEEGLLKEGGGVVEVSSGNTAISVAWIGRRLGIDVYIIVSEKTSKAKVSLIKSLGANVIVAPESFEERVGIAERLAEEKELVFLNQDANPYNHLAHYETTGREILGQVEPRGRIVFVMGVGTGGAVTGVGRRLKEDHGNALVVGVTPRGSPLDPNGRSGRPDYIEGLASSNPPKLFEKYRRYVDLIVPVSEDEAVSWARRLAETEGIPGGPSTGAAIAALRKLEEKGIVSEEDDVVILVADTIIRYPHLLR